MTPATTALYEDVLNGQVTHDGDARLARHVANAVLRVDSRGSRLQKEHRDSRRRIDLAVTRGDGARPRPRSRERAASRDLRARLGLSPLRAQVADYGVKILLTTVNPKLRCVEDHAAGRISLVEDLVRLLLIRRDRRMDPRYPVVEVVFEAGNGQAEGVGRQLRLKQMHLRAQLAKLVHRRAAPDKLTRTLGHRHRNRDRFRFTRQINPVQ